MQKVEAGCWTVGCIRMGREWVAALGCDRIVAARRESESVVVVVRSEGFGPGAYALMECFGCGLVGKEKCDAVRVQGGNVFDIDKCDGMNDG